ncbi:U11/U12 small nuclear ribonucleoprotein 65 kDa protein [Rhodamnia argentea]|uniref:U11/U12 small nuclear ribonucleoprotein 65 kDa protein n=1 Tax=Rhodamnia argentea TaxID=178133 RepID=A0ABM3GRK2_9MYRT|nr:U11/U12 small nuclear ribonucleoprotein 65 kDa protein [Rhodamnia argentea]XP_048126978.1 U11/U12 small nuclear ribonucleoprotein 65 kDa protein [Rhodamnia argentea]XP_048126979.1 U11/U12 small nuclear ribonucleoprotein 65 kDa protein [Rhodamnia argentea]
MDGMPFSQASFNVYHGLQHQQGLPSNSLPADSPITLLIRHLPEAIPQETLSRLLSHYGASTVRPCTSERLKNCAFVDFKSEALAYQAQCQLNGLRFLGRVLKVERASNDSKDNKIRGKGAPSANDKIAPSTVTKEAGLPGDHNENSNCGFATASEPIAPKLGVDYPFPPHLEYAYPPPDGNILTNIVNALIAVPRFYTQVLHLMNKMNIPAPFRVALPTPPLPPSAAVPAPPPPPPTSAKPLAADLSSEESELESSEEEVDDKAHSLGSSTVRSGKKRARKEAIVGPAIDKDVAHESVGVKPATLVPKEIPVIKKKNTVLQIKITPKPKVSTVDEHKDDSTTNDIEEPDQEKLEKKQFATQEELERGRLPPEEILSLPMFKNYTPGNPAPVLYVKNLAKDVIMDDFYFIFGSLFGSADDAKSTLNVKLMQEGRMRGQAFVTFPSIEVAQRALNLVNGYVFKGKPMIIQFGRNPSASKTN